MTQEEIVRKGGAARAVLSDTTIMAFLDEIKEDLKTQIMSTSPDQSKERNILFYQHLGIENLLAYCASYVAAAEAIEANDGNETVL